jgi:hypothetical protein
MVSRGRVLPVVVAVEAWVDPALLEVLAVLAGAWLLLGLRPPLAPE